MSVKSNKLENWIIILSIIIFFLIMLIAFMGEKINVQKHELISLESDLQKSENKISECGNIASRALLMLQDYNQYFENAEVCSTEDLLERTALWGRSTANLEIINEYLDENGK